MEPSFVKFVFKRMCTICLCGLILLTNVRMCLADDTCVPDTSVQGHEHCRCKYSGHIFDLYPLAKGDSPSFYFQTDGKDQQTYYYRPCLAFTIPSTPDDPCKDVAACQKSGPGYFNLGKQDSAKFVGIPESDTSLFGIQYNSTDNQGTQRNTIVHLVCANVESEFTAKGETSTLNYEFTLRTKYACTSGLSTGSILLIVFFVLLLVYIVGGVLFLRYARGARGVEQIPNYTFWLDLPSLIKDGALFLFRGCKTTDNTYNQI